MAPLIGLTSNYFDERYHEKAPDLMPLRDQGAYLIPEDFPRCIERAGGVPVMLPVTDDLSLAARYAEICNGFFLIGGACDVDPRRYGQERSEFVTNLVARNDDFEFALAKYVVEQTDKPLLGVCRGSQVINAAFGGTLIQHLSARGYRGHRFAGGAKGAPQHSVRIEKDSFLYRATGAAELQVNSMHHQAVDTLAPMFHATAFAPDGVIEAYEADGDRLIAGIQWHPEMMDESVQQSICRAFVDRCGRK